MVGTDAKNKNILDRKFICPVCSLILREPLQFNTCGHRLCQSCLQTQNQSVVKCVECHLETPTNQIMLDRGFQTDMQSLPIICSHCTWNGILRNYQEHLDQSHSNPKCDYCDQSFNSINQLNQHQLSQCQKFTVSCILKDFGCHQQIVRCELSNHYQSEQHQDSILNIIHQMNTDTPPVAPNTNTVFDADFLKELYETINILRSGTQALNEDSRRLNDELPQVETKLQSLIEKSSQVKVAIEEENALYEGITQNIELLKQDLLSLEEKIDDMQYVSNDGTFTWKITKFKEKMRDAQSERQTSVYSPAFYSSPVGYKMRARLYLNGDGNARRTHLSLFFVLMRGRNDPILKFPFNYKVTFCLYDQTSTQRHIIDSFRPDIRSSSFQRPRSEMNIASGIPKFFPLSMVEQEGNAYVRNDTMFIKVMVDFGDMPKTLVPYALSLNPGLPTNIQQDMIRQEVERRSRVETSQLHQTTD